MMMNRFEERLKQIQRQHIREAIIDVMDTAEMVLVWMQVHNVTPEPQAISDLTAQILKREKQIGR